MTPPPAPAAQADRLIAGKAIGWGDAPCIRRPGEKPIAQMIPPDLVYYRHVTRREPDGGTVTTFAPATPEGEAAVAEACAEMNRMATLFASAPALLAALEALEAVAPKVEFALKAVSTLDVQSDFYYARGLARAAIRAARGEG